MGVDPRQGNPVLGTKLDDQRLESSNLISRGHLGLEVSEAQHPDVSLILMFHMGALIGHRTRLPDTAGTIDHEVVADVAPSIAAIALEMGHANELDSIRHAGARGSGEWRHAVMMDRDLPGRIHAIHPGWNRDTLRPGRS